MSVRTYLCGTSRTVYHAGNPTVRADPPVRPPKRDRDAVRLRTTLHVPGVPRATRGYRVVAELADGRQALVCLGATRQEAVARARRLTVALHREAVAVSLQEWVGSTTAGRWRTLRCQQLFVVPLRARRRRSA